MWGQLHHRCVSFLCQWEYGASQAVHWKDHIVCLTLDPACMLCGLSVLSLSSVAFTGNKPPRMASSRLNVDSPWLTIYLKSAPDSRRWWINTAGLHKRGGIFMLSLEDTTYAIIMPLTQHLSAGWWIPLIKDHWCYIRCSTCTTSVPPI